MPELPEVETIRRTLAPLITGHVVRRAELLRRDVLVAPGDPPGGFSRNRREAHAPAPVTDDDLLVGATITSVDRHGKQLILRTTLGGRAGPSMIIQLGMSGRVLFEPCPRVPKATADAARRHVHARWFFDAGCLHFEDARRFGGLRVFRDHPALERHLALLGPDALTISPARLAAALAGSAAPIKAALLDQARIAGVGNIYADEALFRAGIHPRTRAGRLPPPYLRALTQALRVVLRRAIRKKGSTIRSYSDASGEAGAYQSQHAVYGRAGERCKRCGGPLRDGTIAQRTTVWCPVCQPRARSTR